MKVIQFKNVEKFVAIIYCASIGIRIVSGIPEKYTASDGREYLIENDHKVNYSLKDYRMNIFMKNFQQHSSTTGLKPFKNVNDAKEVNLSLSIRRKRTS